MNQRRSIAALIAGLAAGAGACAGASAQLQTHTPTPAPYTSTVGAHARYSKARINPGQPDLPLTAALVVAGGGAMSFDAAKLVATLTGNGPTTQTELASLTKRFGTDKVTSFEKTFDFVITDSLAQATTSGMELPGTPRPDPANGKALAAALYQAGVGPHGGYDVEYMLDSLVSHVIHVAVMNDVDANPDLGPGADANYHAVLAQTMSDLKSVYKF